MTGTSAHQVLGPSTLLHFGLKPTWEGGGIGVETVEAERNGSSEVDTLPVRPTAREFFNSLRGRDEEGDLK